MARYDVYWVAQNNSYVVDVQSNLIDGLATRVIVPLTAVGSAPPVLRKLNPEFEIDGKICVFITQYIATLPAKTLVSPVASLKSESDAIQSALDMLFHGF